MAKKQASRKPRGASVAKRKKSSGRKKVAAKKPAPLVQPPQGTATENLDRQLAATAMSKIQAGQVPTQQEQSALKRVEKEQEESRRWEYYKSIPQKHVLEMTGRTLHSLKNVHEQYGWKIHHKTTDLPELLTQILDWLAKNGRKVLAVDRNSEADDMLVSDAASPALERYRDERAKLAKLEREEREGRLIPRDLMQETLNQYSQVLASAFERLQHTYGPEITQELTEAINEAVEIADQFFEQYAARQQA